MNCLSISSHVAHGYVGNRATVFPLQYSGWNVDTINTTNYSNHPGYGSFSGSPTSPDLVKRIFGGIRQIGVHYDMFLTGYTPNAEMLQIVAAELRQMQPQMPVWILDPVLGDNGKFYLSQEVVPVYKEILRSGDVTLVTPNQFEMEVLSGCKIETWEDVEKAIDGFDTSYAVKNLVISSVTIDGAMYAVGHTEKGTFRVPVEVIGCSFNGCGDLFAGLLANAFYKAGVLDEGVLRDVLERLRRVLVRSYEEERRGGRVEVVRDLRIIESRDVFEMST